MAIVFGMIGQIISCFRRVFKMKQKQKIEKNSNKFSRVEFKVMVK